MEVDYNIALNLPYVDILRYCQVNNNFLQICQDDFFWKHKFMRDFDIKLLKHDVNNWKSLYLNAITLTSLYSINKHICDIFDTSKISNRYRDHIVVYIFNIILNNLMDSVYEYENKILVNPYMYIRLDSNFLEDLAWIIYTFNGKILSNHTDPIKNMIPFIKHMFNQLYVEDSIRMY